LMRSEFLYQERVPFATEKKKIEPESIKLNGHTGDVNSIAFSPDGKFVVTASSDATARIWNAANGESIGELSGHRKSVNTAMFSPDGKFIVTASDDGTVRKWDAGSLRVVKLIGTVQVKPVYSAEYSPDGKLLVMAGAEAAWVCDAMTGEVSKTLQGHTSQVNSASFSPDSKLVVTSSSDNTARVWNAKTGESIATLLDHKKPVLHAVFSPDGQSVLTASEDYTTRVYPREAFAPFEELRLLINKRVARKLTPQEEKDYLKEPENV
jgi:WD40 repeat protein